MELIHSRSILPPSPSSRQFFPLLLVLLLSTLYSACPTHATSFGVFHLSARQAWSNCTTPRIPWNLCTACQLKPFNGTGNNVTFSGQINRFDIYNISTPYCKSAMQRYVRENPCDVRRAAALAKMDTSESAYKVMAYFLYSVCELCCDCIPIGAREDEYWRRRLTGNLVSIFRGNCPAHFFYDTCKIWPESRQILNSRDKPYRYALNEKSEWCGHFKTWQFSNYSKNWLRNNNVKGMTWLMRRAMNQMMHRAKCKQRTQWINCLRMEKAQRRV